MQILCKYCIFQVQYAFQQHCCITVCKITTLIKQIIAQWWLPCHSTLDLLANSASSQVYKSSQWRVESRWNNCVGYRKFWSIRWRWYFPPLKSDCKFWFIRWRWYSPPLKSDRKFWSIRWRWYFPPLKSDRKFWSIRWRWYFPPLKSDRKFWSIRWQWYFPP